MTVHFRDVSSDCSGDEALALFDRIRATLQLQNLPALASRLRRKNTAAADMISSGLSCHVLPDPMYGSHHILFKVEFNDGVRWILKVPANGYPDAFDALSARALKCEALTMRLIERKTTVPLPQVLHFEDTLDNDLGCPFILMEYVDSRPLHEIWFDQTTDPEVVEQRRCRALDGVARAIIQLNKFVFTRGGEIRFDECGNPCGIGSVKVMKIDAMLKSMDEDDNLVGHSFRTVGPFSSARSWFLCMLDKREPPPDDYGLRVYKALRLFIDQLFPVNNSSHEDGEEGGEEFVLAHPDFDIQNVIVAEDGSLLALVDWDGVCTVPRCLGNEAYPSWLTRDWAKYCFDESAPAGPDSPNNNENSPSELKHYREVYQKIIEKLSDDPSTAKKITLNSLLLDNLYIAATDPICTHSIIGKILQEIKAKTTSVELNGHWASKISSSISDSEDDCKENEDSTVDGEHTQAGFCEGANNINYYNKHDCDDLFPYEVLTAFQSGKLSKRNLERLTSGFQALML